MGKVIEVDFKARRKRAAEPPKPKPAKNVRRKGNFSKRKASPGRSDRSFVNQDELRSDHIKCMEQSMLDHERTMDYRFVGILINHETPLVPRQVVLRDCRLLADHAYWYTGKPQDFCASLDGLVDSEHMRRTVFALRISMLARITAALADCPEPVRSSLTSRLLQGLSLYLRTIAADLDRYRGHFRRMAVASKWCRLVLGRSLADRALRFLRRRVQAEFEASVGRADMLVEMAGKAAGLRVKRVV